MKENNTPDEVIPVKPDDMPDSVWSQTTFTLNQCLSEAKHRCSGPYVVHLMIKDDEPDIAAILDPPDPITREALVDYCANLIHSTGPRVFKTWASVAHSGVFLIKDASTGKWCSSPFPMRIVDGRILTAKEATDIVDSIANPAAFVGFQIVSQWSDGPVDAAQKINTHAIIAGYRPQAIKEFKEGCGIASQDIVPMITKSGPADPRLLMDHTVFLSGLRRVHLKRKIVQPNPNNNN